MVTQNAQLTSLLQRLGLTEDESCMMLAVYRHPGSPVGRLAQYVGVKRGYAYNMVSGLVGKGLLTEVTERGVLRIRAIDPAQLVSRIEQQQEALGKLLGDMRQAVGTFEALIPPLSGLPRVQVFRGVQGVQELYEFTLTAKEKTIRACADFNTSFPRGRSPELHEWMWRYATRRAKKGILYRGMVVRSKETDLAYKRKRVQRRELRELVGCQLSVELMIFDRYVAVCSTADEMMGVLLESEPLARSATSLFDVMWQGLPEYRVKTRRGKGASTVSRR